MPLARAAYGLHLGVTGPVVRIGTLPAGCELGVQFPRLGATKVSAACEFYMADYRSRGKGIENGHVHRLTLLGSQG